MSDERIMLSHRGVAYLILGGIVDPEGTVDGGFAQKRRAIELMEAAGLSTADANHLLQEWLDTPQSGDLIADEDSLLIKAMTAGVHVLFKKEGN